MTTINSKIMANLSDYEKVKTSFSWENVAKELSGLPEGKGLNIAHEGIDRHAQSHLKDSVALRFIRKDRSFQDFSYFEMQKQTSQFANVRENLCVQKGNAFSPLQEGDPWICLTHQKNFTEAMPLFAAIIRWR